MSKEIILTPDGGRFYRAMVFHWVTVSLAFFPLLIALLIAIVNPFWFRDSMFNFIERNINKFTRWRNNLKYHIYLGCDPKVWHTLKGDI